MTITSERTVAKIGRSTKKRANMENFLGRSEMVLLRGKS